MTFEIHSHALAGDKLRGRGVGTGWNAVSIWVGVATLIYPSIHPSLWMRFPSCLRIISDIKAGVITEWENSSVHSNPTYTEIIYPLQVRRKEKTNTGMEAQYIICAVMPKQNRSSNEKMGHRPAANYHARHFARVKYITSLTACLLFFLYCHLSGAHYFYLFYCLQT